MYTCCRRTYSVTGHGCENTQKDRSWNLAHKIRCTLGLRHNQEGFRNKRYIWMSKEWRKKNILGSKGTTTAVQSFTIRCSTSWTFWHYHNTQISIAKHKHDWKWLLNLFRFVRKASKYLWVCLHSNRYHPFFKRKVSHIFYCFECTLWSDSYLYIPHPNKHTCWKTKGEAGILIWQDTGSVLHFSGFPLFQSYKNKYRRTKTKQKLYKSNTFSFKYFF